MADSLSLNGLNLFETKVHKTELTNGLNGWKMAILAIANLLGTVFLNCVSTSVRDIVSISAKLTMRLFFCFVVEARYHKRGILNAQKPIGENIRRHTHERNGKLA